MTGRGATIDADLSMRARASRIVKITHCRLQKMDVSAISHLAARGLLRNHHQKAVISAAAPRYAELRANAIAPHIAEDSDAWRVAQDEYCVDAGR